MNRHTFLASMILLFVVSVNTACIHVDNEDLVEYICEGGSKNDITLIPNYAEKIRISNMPVGRISKDLFSRFDSNLIVLTCSYCMITDIDDDAFRRLEKLEQLSFDNNYLKEVKAKWFEGLVSLTYLNLNYNGIEQIDKGVFYNVPNLVDLRLSGNQLLCLDLESLSKLNVLKRIFLNENHNFTCPIAMKKFLTERRIDFEADDHWSMSDVDRVSIKKSFSKIQPIFKDSSLDITLDIPPSTIPNSPSSVPFTISSKSLSSTPTSSNTKSLTTETFLWSSTIQTTNLPSKRPYIPEMINPAVPEQDFSYQGPYYAPEITQQQLDFFRSTLPDQTEVDNKVYIIPTTMTTFSECPNVATCFSINSSLFIILMLTVTFFVHKWTLEGATLL